MNSVRTAALVVAALAAAPAAAQLTTAATASGQINGSSVPSASCGQAFETGVTVGCTRTGPSGARISGSARTDVPGKLRAQSSARAAGAATDTLGIGSASWTERVFYDPLDAPLRVVQSIRITGTQLGDVTSDIAGIDASTVAFMRLFAVRDGQWANPAARDELVFVRSMDLLGGGVADHRLGTQRTVRGVDLPFESGPVSPSLRVFDLTLEFWLDPGSEYYDLTWNFAVNSFVYAGASGSVVARYFRTATLTGLQFFDEDGADVTFDRGIRFGSGTGYLLGPPAAAIPEPATWALLIAGFGLAGAALRRRPAQASTPQGAHRAL
ncbi:MAG: PEPxxWA-CTERM sorting domain-containing protein [Sphingomonadaceae bacterium]